MTPEEKIGLHDAVIRNTAADPAWLGFWLLRHQQTEKLNLEQLAEKLGIAMENLILLCLCRTPRNDQFLEDLRVVCRRTGAKELVLAHILRQEKNLQNWTESGMPRSQGWLMAASDRPAEDQKPSSAEESHDN